MAKNPPRPPPPGLARGATPTLLNVTGKPLAVAGGEHGTIEIVPHGSRVKLPPSPRGQWSIAFAEGAKPLAAIKTHPVTGALVADADPAAAKRFAVSVGAAAGKAAVTAWVKPVPGDHAVK